MNVQAPYRKYADLLADYFPYKVQKLPVDGGFTCPNRDGTKGRGGCSYCLNSSFHPAYGQSSLSITEQLEKGKRFFAGHYPNMKYLAYFQSFTNTYAPLTELKRKYEEALQVPDVVGLVISTRPDCLSDEVLHYLKQLHTSSFVILEIGVESCDDQILKAVNRCHTFSESEDAIERAAAVGIPVCAHVILGLSYFGTYTAREEALCLSKMPISSVKIHQLQILRGTKLAHLYDETQRQQTGESTISQQMFSYLSLSKYIDELGVFISHLRPDIAVERLVSQSPSELLIAPRWGMKPEAFQLCFEKHLTENGLFQGKFYDSFLRNVANKRTSNDIQY